MGANPLFKKMLPAIDVDASFIVNSKRQVEIFTHGGKLCLRIGAINQADSGVDQHTVELSTQHAKELIAAIDSGVAYFGGD